MVSKLDSIKGCLIGCAVGDALGLHKENMTRRRASKMFPNPDRYYFLGKYGCTSDDYDHASMTLEALCAAEQDPSIFAHELANRIKIWSACIPGGIGFATLRSSVKLWLGSSPAKSGVFSAGNGPAMRSHVLGACITDIQQLIEFVRASTSISHTDPKAFTGALVIAMASLHSSTAITVDSAAFLKAAMTAVEVANGDSAVNSILEQIVASVRSGETTREFVNQFGNKGVTGYIYHTVPAVIHAWLRNPEDFSAALKTIIDCGGDTDTTASILGGIIGSRLSIRSIPQNWVNNLILWPRDLRAAEILAENYVNHRKVNLQVVAWKYLLRNAWFDSVVLAHGARRVFPPY